jgi:hypothetical protein
MADLSNKLYTHFHTPRLRVDAVCNAAGVSVSDLLTFADAEGFAPEAALKLVEQGCTPRKVREAQAALRECRLNVFSPDEAVVAAAEAGIASLKASIRPYFDLHADYATARAAASFASRTN